MISTRLVGGAAGNGARITKEGAIHVVQHPHPPEEGDLNYPIPFSSFFVDGAGSKAMNVLGSAANPVTFRVSSIKDFDVYIKSITIEIGQAGARLDQFAAIPALTNGIKFCYTNQDLGIIEIFDAFKTNLDFFREATGGKGFSVGVNAWLADISGTGADTYFPEIDLHERYGLQWGFKLARDVSDEISFTVQDDLTGVTKFNIKAHGFVLRK